MLLVDVNVLLYAVNDDAEQHETARRWLTDALRSAEPVGLAWVVLLAFLRISTRSGIFPRPLSSAQALGLVESWLVRPAVVVVDPTPRHLAVLAGLLGPRDGGGNLVNDAHLAALAVEHGATVVSYDADFARFPGVRSRFPA
jgi:toxin-antitoxin system PIN domain toxin